ncbi:MAG: UPF0175 family protein [Ignavibacteriae bacterium]|nr:UPF0175 family protein [Ignavibacteriota bacterium]
MSKTVEIVVPEEVINCWGTENNLTNVLARLSVVELVRMGKVSVGKACELLGISYTEGMTMLSHHDVSTVNFSVEELNNQVADWNNNR